MFGRKRAWLALVVLVVWAGVGAATVRADGASASEIEASRRLQSAVATQAATRASLLVVGEGRSCGEAGFVAYRRSDVEYDLVDEWYVASQLWADAQLLAASMGRPPLLADGARQRAGRLKLAALAYEPSGRCYLDKGFAFLERLWDARLGGYYPRFHLAQGQIDRETRYADDNALTGLALLAAAETASDATTRGRYLDAARREADFLLRSGLWDATFGGGFWWTTDRGDTDEGKPAQTNAIAALFLGRLHQATGAGVYREWTLRTLFWMDTVLYEPSRDLYRWSVHYQDPARRTGPIVRSPRFFNYDQGIAIEAQLLAARLDGEPGRLARARELGQALHRDFWSQHGGGYNLQAGVEQVYTSYASWASLGHLALHDVDGDPRWLDMARANAAALTAALRRTDGGYALRHYRCVDRVAPGCERGQAISVLDHTRDGAAQAWMQQLQTGLAQRIAEDD
ncbi:MAG: hypothetical protein H0V51_22030 [Chloroflexi bacterium]|nr:hypothetical protein [Chloroflexota bacterium]